MTDKQNAQITVNLILVNVKLNALKLTLSSKDLEIYNNHILDEVAKFKPSLENLLTPEELEIILKAFLK
jgi:hypothetical protein